MKHRPGSLLGELLRCSGTVHEGCASGANGMCLERMEWSRYVTAPALRPLGFIGGLLRVPKFSNCFGSMLALFTMVLRPGIQGLSTSRGTTKRPQRLWPA